MRTRILVLFLAVVFSTLGSRAFAQDPGSPKPAGTVFQEYPSSLGVSLSGLDTFGLSWKRWFGKVGVEISAGGAWDPASEYGTIYWYALTSALSYRLYAEDFAKWLSGGLYLVAYAGHTGEDGYEYQVPSGGGDGSYVRTGFSPSLLAGAGIGIETVLFKHFSQELQFLYIGRFISNPGLDFGVNASFRYRY